MRSWFGSWFVSSQADAVEVTVLATENDITIGYRLDDGTVKTQKWNMDDLQVSFDHSVQSSRVVNTELPHGKLYIEGKDALNFIEQVQAERQKPWHKKKKTKEWTRGFSIFLGIILILITTYFLIVPWLSEKMASTVSPDTEMQFGNAVYDALTLSKQEDKEASNILNEFFREMKINSEYRIRITVVNNEIVNAFALPGGHIVVYTGLLKQLQGYPELAALLSHEFTHINNKHSTKSIFRQLGSRVFLRLLFGNFGSVTSLLADQAERFKSLKYSRTLEKEADLEGLAILIERKIDPGGFAALFNRLKNAGATILPEFLASHPDIDKRINYIHTVALNSSVEEHIPLKNIFEKLKPGK